ncbi:hypothetical protein BS47DRAFT_1390579 [Hydnum rufescens UP504]|uniref:Cryptic loci regulator 2 N-terminal domain-containing protein n=1 Tax=Hydnum rufescens UP504 TaxID=1448309 RepID=A0A9P6DZ04_9AGAM|nr:hypothetical protein BS47DRAFT_1390579 [Hydnum rufescens UP504]
MGYLLINRGRVASASDPRTASTSRPRAGATATRHVKKKPGTPYSGKLRFPNSDGDSTRWPTSDTGVAPDDTHGFFRIDDEEANNSLPRMEQQRRASVLNHWKEKIGTYLGNKFKETEGYRYILRDFPVGYALFAQKRIANPDRRDLYLYGSSSVVCFRSPEEFYDHAEWLMLGDSKPCVCQYCDPNSPRRKNKKRQLSPEGPGGRSASSNISSPELDLDDEAA